MLNLYSTIKIILHLNLPGGFFEAQLNSSSFVYALMPFVKTNFIRFLFISILIACLLQAQSQQVTGVWKGKIDNKKVEVKIIQKGDSLTGTSYYYESPSVYKRYSIKGYFDQENNSVVWWDDQLIEEKGFKLFNGKTSLLSVADFNCPGGGEMYLNGRAAAKENPDKVKGPVDLTKVPLTGFTDEWDYVIENYTVGANDPEFIDSVALIAYQPVVLENPPVIEKTITETVIEQKKESVYIPPAPQEEIKKEQPLAVVPLTIEEKFSIRKKVFVTEIPVSGDSIELRFYDNAEVDGDSISLFLNQTLIFQHIRLSDKAYTIKLAVSALDLENELTMVAENLGTIPPNTSYMVAIVGDKRYEAKLASTENSSALIKLKKLP
jgi:hypothetical protein